MIGRRMIVKDTVDIVVLNVSKRDSICLYDGSGVVVLLSLQQQGVELVDYIRLYVPLIVARY